MLDLVKVKWKEWDPDTLFIRQPRTVLISLERNWPWDSCWNMASYILKIFEASSPRKGHNISPGIKSIFTFLYEAGELDFSLRIYFIFCSFVPRAAREFSGET